MVNVNNCGPVDIDFGMSSVCGNSRKWYFWISDPVTCCPEPCYVVLVALNVGLQKRRVCGSLSILVSCFYVVFIFELALDKVLFTSTENDNIVER